MTQTRLPRAVLISDIHFSVPTLELASTSLRMAINRANDLCVPLIIAGDLLDGKAVLRAEVVNRLIEIVKEPNTCIHLIPGNHDMINEKSNAHVLNFLGDYVHLISVPTKLTHSLSPTSVNNIVFVPYQTDIEFLRHYIGGCQNKTVILHQGVQSAYMGHYVQDKTSLEPGVFADVRAISGHYHRAQDIKCGRPRKGALGLFSYIGNPYTLTFGEANDGPKGFQILYDDGLLEQVPTNLRKHIIVERELDAEGRCFDRAEQFLPGDNVWFKLTGDRRTLSKISAQTAAKAYEGHGIFKFDKIFRESDSQAETEITAPKEGAEILDKKINELKEPEGYKTALKQTWRGLIE